MLPLVGVAASEQPVIERPANVDALKPKAADHSNDASE
jgi:hypothetical protein